MSRYQKKGNVVTAQQFALKAHDLMDKAMQMQGHAEGAERRYGFQKRERFGGRELYL